MTPVRRASVIGTVPPSLTFDEISADRTFARNTAGVEDIDIDACADVAGDWAPLKILESRLVHARDCGNLGGGAHDNGAIRERAQL